MTARALVARKIATSLIVCQVTASGCHGSAVRNVRPHRRTFIPQLSTIQNYIRNKKLQLIQFTRVSTWRSAALYFIMFSKARSALQDYVFALCPHIKDMYIYIIVLARSNCGSKSHITYRFPHVTGKSTCLARLTSASSSPGPLVPAGGASVRASVPGNNIVVSHYDIAFGGGVDPLRRIDAHGSIPRPSSLGAMLVHSARR